MSELPQPRNILSILSELAYTKQALKSIAMGKDEMEMFCITNGISCKKGEPLSRAIAEDVLKNPRPFGL